ncbi:hypothetical protein PUN28_004914 [Cardiocondyla obscurior]|uniref:Exosome complex component RRP45 n=1 Tax=Cardiocondyla obscurior TaxID=286306 RepID=A0AAW2GD26_9HYME
MKEIPFTNCERNFVNKCIEEETRLDGRKLLEPRPVKINFGSNWGCCMVSLGHTRAVAQVSCDIQQPKTSRPNEGMIRISVELTPLAAQHFESGRQSEAAILISRQLEKCFKDSKCIDLESLCIVADKKVWNLRIDINIINHDGNLVDCASIATLAALMHFHRPDVTSTGEEVIIHLASEKDFLPLTLFHYPVCISFITFKSGNSIMDPTYTEEKVGVAELTLADYATKLVQHIKEAVIKDVQSRYKKDDSNISRFKESIQVNKLTTTIGDYISIKLRKWNATAIAEDDTDNFMEIENEDKSHVIKREEGSAELIPVFNESNKKENPDIDTYDSDWEEVLVRSPSLETKEIIDLADSD